MGELAIASKMATIAGLTGQQRAAFIAGWLARAKFETSRRAEAARRPKVAR